MDKKSLKRQYRQCFGAKFGEVRLWQLYMLKVRGAANYHKTTVLSFVMLGFSVTSIMGLWFIAGPSPAMKNLGCAALLGGMMAIAITGAIIEHTTRQTGRVLIQTLTKSQWSYDGKRLKFSHPDEPLQEPFWDLEESDVEEMERVFGKTALCPRQAVGGE